MNFLIAFLSVAFAAVCLWLGVRIVNRRERWAKRTLAAAIALPILYVLSFGPACWTCSRNRSVIPVAEVVYRPVIWTWFNSPRPIRRAGMWYASLAAQGTVIPGGMGGGRLVLHFIPRELESAFGIPESNWP